MKCDLNKAKRKHISGSTVKSSICTATLFLLPQLRTVHPACCPFSATRPDRKPTQSNSKYLFSILSWPPSIASPIAAVRTKNTVSKHGLRLHMCVFIQTCIYDDTRTHVGSGTRTGLLAWGHRVCLSQKVGATGPHVSRLGTQHALDRQRPVPALSRMDITFGGRVQTRGLTQREVRLILN